MKQRHRYEQLIGQKLNHLPAMAAYGCWNCIEAILDQVLPQKRKRRSGNLPSDKRQSSKNKQRQPNRKEEDAQSVKEDTHY